MKIQHRAVPALPAVLAALAIMFSCALPAPAADAVTQAIADLGSRNRGESQQAGRSLLAQGKKAVPQLVAALDDRDEDKKASVAIILGQLKATEAVPRLIEELKSKNEDVRFSSALALGLIGDSRALPHLAALLGPGGDQTSKGAALIALGRLKNKDAVLQVKAVLADPDPNIRVLAATTLGALGNHEGLDVALDGTRSDDQSLVLVSIQAIGLIGDARALPRLEEMNQASDAWQSDIELARKQIEYAGAGPEKRVKVLRGHLDDQSRHVAEWAVTALADLGTPEAISVLEEKARDGNSRSAGLAQMQLEMLGK